MYATFLVVEIADRFLGQALYGNILFSVDKGPPKKVLLSTFEGNVDLLPS